jgi:hypothetical protein
MDSADLSPRLQRALEDPAVGDRRSSLEAMLDLYDLHLGPIEELDGAERWQHHPRVAALKLRLEAGFRTWLDDQIASCAVPWDDAGAALRQLAHDAMVPPIYTWLADEADLDDLVEFISLEGGPDADFDDLVALCQVGLAGLPKLTLGANYWDEMGRGSLGEVHTELYRRMAGAIGVRAVPIEEQPIEALERNALNGYLATNRTLQPELLGSLGLIECQAGPRCRRIVAAMERLGVPGDALPFYAEHALADPRHGHQWIEGAVVPLTRERPEWNEAIARGAAWRACVNRRFFATMEERFGLRARVA